MIITIYCPILWLRFTAMQQKSTYHAGIILSSTYYAENYAGIISLALFAVQGKTANILSLECFVLYYGIN